MPKTQSETSSIEKLWVKYPEFKELRAFPDYEVVQFQGDETFYLTKVNEGKRCIVCFGDKESILKELSKGYSENDFILT